MSLKITRRGYATGIALGFALGLTAPVWNPLAATPADAHPPRPAIHEDDPRWDCRLDGNRTCGIVIHGQRYLVTFNRHATPIRTRVAK